MINLFSFRRNHQVVKKSCRHTVLQLEGLEDRITPNTYTWYPEGFNAPHTTGWMDEINRGGTIFTNWRANGNNSSGLPSSSDQVVFSGDVSNTNCVLNNIATVAVFTMGHTISSDYTGTLTLDAALSVVNGGFVMQAGTITLNNGNGNAAALTLQDIPSGSNGGSWSGGTIQDAAGSNGYLLLQASNRTTSLINTTGRTNKTTLLANMTIQGTSSFNATYTLSTGMTTNMVLGAGNTITVDNHGFLKMLAQNAPAQNNGFDQTDFQGGIASNASSTVEAISVQVGGELDRGVSTDNANMGGVLVYNPIGSKGIVRVYAGDRLDINEMDSSSAAFYQSGGTTHIYSAVNAQSQWFTGTICTTEEQVPTLFGDIYVDGGGFMQIDCYSSASGNTAPAWPALDLASFTSSASARIGTLIIEGGSTLYLHSVNGPNSPAANVCGKVKFMSDGSELEIEAWPTSSDWEQLNIVSFNSEVYGVTIANTNTTLYVLLLGGGTFAQGAQIDPIFNASGGNKLDITDLFATVTGNDTSTYSQHWDINGHLVLTKN